MRNLSRRLTHVILRIEGIEELLGSAEGVTDTELCLLYALDDGAAHSQKEISKVWELPRTTLNTIVKRWQSEGLLTLTKIPGKRREMAIALTDAGKAKAQAVLAANYAAEDRAIAETAEKFGQGFVEALEFYAEALERNVR